MNNKFFSIVIPTFNNLKLFKQAIYSVLNQTFKNYEIVIVDDSTSEIISSFVKENILNLPIAINYFRNRPSKGAVKNWNYGLSKAKGKFCIILHHDEYFSTSNILNEIAYKFSFSDYNCLIINKLVIKNNLRYTLKINSKIIHFILSKTPSFLFIINLIGPCACVSFKRKNAPYFNENLKWLVDVEWYYFLLKNSKSLYINNLYIYSSFGHETQITKNLNIKNQLNNDLKYLIKSLKINKSLKILLIFRFLIDNMKYLFFKNMKNPFYKKHENS